MINIPPELLTNARMHYTYLHEHPELSFAEEQTAAYIRRILDRLQIQSVSYTHLTLPTT